jgi:hypothetical protein
VTEKSRVFVRLIRELHVSHCCCAADGLYIEYIVGMQLMYWAGLFGTTLYNGDLYYLVYRQGRRGIII